MALVDWERLQKGQWLDSWDAAFKGEESSDFVVGQRWVREGGDRFLIAQQRGRWSFTQTLDRMTVWAGSDPITSPYGHLVHTRLIEDAANGPAIIDSLRSKISGLTPVRPDGSKEARARSVSPEIESGNVYLPHPAMSGYEWVTDLVSEFREFPSGAHDDQVDALSQALRRLRGSLGGGVTVPGAHGDQLPGILGTRLPSRVESARTMHRR